MTSASASDLEALFFANISRVLAGQGTPKILLGGINLTGPNFHTVPLVEMGASVVSISLDPDDHGRPDRLFCHPYRPISEAIQRLPPKWRPDFFFDSQVEHGHYIPPGLCELDFPLLASFNHAHLGQALLHLDGMFDCLIKPSEGCVYGDAYLPWGASWGTMDGRLLTIDCPVGNAGERPIDVSCTIGTKIGKWSTRHAALARMLEIQKRRTDWKVEIATDLDLTGYFNLLAQSKVSINVGAWGCTMTYRPLEVICQGSALVHMDETAYGSTSSLAEFFKPHWYTSATPDTLENAISEALKKTPEELAAVKAEVDAEYSYARQYERLFALAKTIHHGARMNSRDFSRRAAAIAFVNGYDDQIFAHISALHPEDLRTIKRHDESKWTGISLWAPEDFEKRYCWQTDLAKAEKEPELIYSDYAD